MPITITDNTIIADVQISEIPDKYIRASLKDISNLVEFIIEDLPTDHFMHDYNMADHGYIQNLRFRATVNLENIRFISELMIHLNVDVDNIVHDHVENYRNRQANKKDYPKVTVVDKKITFENLLPAQENYLRELFDANQ